MDPETGYTPVAEVEENSSRTYETYKSIPNIETSIVINGGHTRDYLEKHLTSDERTTIPKFMLAREVGGNQGERTLASRDLLTHIASTDEGLLDVVEALQRETGNRLAYAESHLDQYKTLPPDEAEFFRGQIRNIREFSRGLNGRIEASNSKALKEKSGTLNILLDRFEEDLSPEGANKKRSDNEILAEVAAEQQKAIRDPEIQGYIKDAEARAVDIPNTNELNKDKSQILFKASHVSSLLSMMDPEMRDQITWYRISNRPTLEASVPMDLLLYMAQTGKSPDVENILSVLNQELGQKFALLNGYAQMGMLTTDYIRDPYKFTVENGNKILEAAQINRREDMEGYTDISPSYRKLAGQLSAAEKVLEAVSR